MKNSLKTIQVFAQIGRVFCIIARICSIVGAVGCLVGILSLAAGVDELFKIGGVTIYGLIKNESGLNTGSMYASMTMAMIICLGEIALALNAERYFKNELKAGTPFTFDGADEMKRLGILAICIPVGTTVVAEIAYQIIDAISQNAQRINFDNYTSIGLGVAFIAISFVFRYGAEQKAENTTTYEDTEKTL